MNSDVLLSVNNISKQYTLQDERGSEVITVLDRVNFELRRGESIGLIGRNGSGKTTLLKILAGFVKPTSGEVLINGKVNSMIEVGSNFLPDLSGRENTRNFLSFHDSPSSETDAIVQSVQEFSELGQYFDQPVKNYSAGMFVRASMSAGFHINAEIFLIDEILMAGDVSFKEKMSNHFLKVLAGGAGFILASHNPQEILENCLQAIWLEKGEVMAIGDTYQVVDSYYRFIESEKIRKTTQANADSQEPSYMVDEFSSIPSRFLENEAVRVENLEVRPMTGKAMTHEDEFVISATIVKKTRSMSIHPMFRVHDSLHRTIALLPTSDEKEITDTMIGLREKSGVIRVECVFPSHVLRSGVYFLEFVVGADLEMKEGRTQQVFRLPVKLKFSIADPADMYRSQENMGIRPTCAWSLQLGQSSEAIKPGER